MIRDIIHKKRGLNRVALQWIMLWDFTTTTTILLVVYVAWNHTTMFLSQQNHSEGSQV